jgi:Tfp pilus assembly protein PilN
MLRSNLSTRPFYNDRAVRTVLGLLAAVAVALTLFNAYEIIRLRQQGGEARQTIERNDIQARELRDKAAVIRRSIDRTRLEAVQLAANEANALIDRRTFSWTELLNQFQKTLPADVRIAGVTPQFDEAGNRLVQISVLSRRFEDLETFMEALEKTGAFSGVLSRSNSQNDDGTLQSSLQAYYLPGRQPAAGSPPAASEPGEASGNRSSDASVETPGTAPGNASPANQSPAGNVSAGRPR